jgi:predicted small lipoprotein YifL
VRRRAVALVVAAGIALTLAACGSKDNGGVIQGPTGTTAPSAATSTTY